MHGDRSAQPRFSLATALALAACLAVGAVACAETNGSTAPATSANAAGKPGGPEVGWADMVKDQRIEYMKTVVLPGMKQAFTNFSPDRFSKMNCVTCHGDSATDGSFKMPNPNLPKLPTTPDGFKQLAQEKPAVFDFMKSEVKPKMAAFLGVPEWNPETKSGFACMDCHTAATP
ncbi:MAG TPA: hypothetical protein VKQ32_01720 [Polyangia bacterium]|nr:hypothetical protein [Polyangia bacterium]